MLPTERLSSEHLRPHCSLSPAGQQQNEKVSLLGQKERIYQTGPMKLWVQTDCDVSDISGRVHLSARGGPWGHKVFAWVMLFWCVSVQQGGWW